MKTKRLLVIDAAWQSCGMASEIIAAVVEKIPFNYEFSKVKRLCLPSCPAPTSTIHENEYYFDKDSLEKEILGMLK